MNHTNKMILVPHNIVGENESITKYLSNLDREMLNILKDDTLPTDVKLAKYNQILQRFQTTKHETEQPVKIEIQEQVQPSLVKNEFTAPEDILASTIPPKWQKQAKLLLSYARNNPHLDWTDKGEMVVDGNKIVGSNIVDLINDLSRDRKAEPVVGSEVFLQKLVAENVPKELIVNKRRLSMLKSEVYASPEKSPPVRSRATSLLPNWSGLVR